jgi:hypothetical protein
LAATPRPFPPGLSAVDQTPVRIAGLGGLLFLALRKPLRLAVAEQPAAR